MKHFICLMISQRCVANNRSMFICLARVSVFSCRFGFLQEEKLEPLRNITDDPRIRLLNRLYARKRKELKEREKLKVITSFFCSFLRENIFFIYIVWLIFVSVGAHLNFLVLISLQSL